MSTELEDGLRRALGEAAERAPRAPSGLSGQVVARSRRRRARGHALVAAAAVVVIAGGAGVAANGAGDGSLPASGPEVGISQEAEVTPGGGERFPNDRRLPKEVPPALEEVWPNAVWRIPDKLPNGRKHHPLAFIDDRTLLVSTWASHELSDAIYAYDVPTGKARKITNIRSSLGEYADGFQVVGDRVYFETFDNGVSRFWWVPVSGGKPREIRVTKPIPGRYDALAVAGDRLAFSMGEGGVYTVPLEGGAPTPVPGAERHHILRWPWVGTPGEYTPDDETSFLRLLNAETGETSTAVVRPGEENVRCGVTHCAGRRQDGSGFYRLRDGSGEREMPLGTHLAMAADRFTTGYLARPADGQILYDLRTGKSAHLERSPDKDGSSSVVQLTATRGPLVTHRLPGTYVIINLDRID